MKTPSLPKILLKCVAVFFAVMMLWGIGIFLVDSIVEYNDEKNVADKIRACDSYYYEKDFGDLRDYLILYDLYDTPYALYWEAVDGYNDYQLYLQWTRAAERGLADSSAMAALYKEKVEENYRNCAFENNRSQLASYLNTEKTPEEE